MKQVLLAVALLFAGVLAASSPCPGSSTLNSQMPSPFTRVLCYEQATPYTGRDVTVLQNLIIRSPYVNSSLPLTGVYDYETNIAVNAFQQGNGITTEQGIFGPVTANTLLNLHSCDGYVDEGLPASHYGSQYLYKFHFQVFQNRSLETRAALYDANNTLLHQFRIRTHGWDNATANPPWPYFSNTIGLNMFTSNGNTPTGLAGADLNSPEPDIAEYGPFPINRMINGLEGNAKFLLDENAPLRSGILLHTGAWRLNSDWTTRDSMPNSEGCIHAHPGDIEMVWQKLLSIGVKVNPNPYGEIPYPFPPQGLFSIEQVGCQ